MDEELVLKLLKIDLMVVTDRMDDYYRHLIAAAGGFITREGIRLTESAEDTQLVLMYAAYLHRKRKDPNAAMPRMLRWALNNRLLSEKARGVGG